MAGGKGGSQSTSVKVPDWLETAAKGNLARADQVSQIGYTPYYGPDVAAMTPRQLDAMRNTNSAAAAFGMDYSRPNAGMPKAETFDGGVRGYSSQPIYQGSVDALKAASPGQYAAIMGNFVNPVTGAAPRAPMYQPTISQPAAPIAAQQARDSNGFVAASPVQVQQGAGYTGLRDMINGGGPGSAGATFVGGPFSGALNNAGVQPRSGGGSGMGGGK